ncbi:ATP-binding protein [Streptomyces sp. UNOC14_S4]|uniref:ATP-binding protein n=1 Tax=Streptomyces sp. UNOC14_S4 TaxID=2872340 RepID=UPI001E590441|nr:ATP-binding protein [Streptomyces sp. UNOC14_S4]MCC3766056.1 ATP-binding protein [Streptomyces sp. UNOC14_S4]
MAVPNQGLVQEYEDVVDMYPDKGDTIGRIRRIVRARLRLWGLVEELDGARLDLPVTDDVLVVVSELLTNVYRHADKRATLLMQRSGTALYVEVADGSSALPELREPDWEEGTGRGLHVVEAVTEAYDVVRADVGKRVCCLFEVPAPYELSPCRTLGWVS